MLSLKRLISVSDYPRKCGWNSHAPADVDEILRHCQRKREIAEDEPTDVSELVQELLADWLIEQHGK